MSKKYKYIYGPVYSWRLGMSLGIDPLAESVEKVCNFGCVYCQLGETRSYTDDRREFVSIDEVLRELSFVPKETHVDYYTFSGIGEPTLAKNLGGLIDAVKRQTSGKVAVITNSTLLNRPDVQADLMKADCILAKLDAWDQDSLEMVNKPSKNVCFKDIFDGIDSFCKNFNGKFALQVMLIEDNKDQAQKIADIAKKLDIDEVQINTPLRSCAKKPLNEDQISSIENLFFGLPVVSVYKSKRRNTQPLDVEATKKRHGSV